MKIKKKKTLKKTEKFHICKPNIYFAQNQNFLTRGPSRIEDPIMVYNENVKKLNIFGGAPLSFH